MHFHEMRYEAVDIQSTVNHYRATTGKSSLALRQSSGRKRFAENAPRAAKIPNEVANSLLTPQNPGLTWYERNA